MRTMWGWAVALMGMGCTAELELAEVERIDLEALALGDVQVTGVSVAPDGQVVVSEQTRGVYARGADGWSQVVSSEQLYAADPDDPNLWSTPFLTDVAALGAGRYAVTVPNVGLLYDADTDTSSVHFCYLPGFMDASVVRQHTDSLTYDPQRDLLIANPETLDGDEHVQLDLATFDAERGGDLDWLSAKGKERASALAVDTDGSVLLALGERLVRTTLADPEHHEVLGSLGVSSVPGFAVDPADGTLWFVDGDRQELVHAEWVD
ncbi:MAG: hypothetical protein KTR31_32620 [Myxococcales bacterium]|nr:hypothetical protein [Myxococcales bacterium]